MYRIDSYWAAMLITSDKAKSEEEINTVIQELQRKLDTGEFKKISCGVEITVTTLCSDIYKKDETTNEYKVYKFVNLKAEN